jgi:hypothetical protein
MERNGAHDPRVLAILTAPDEYFAQARRRAWLLAQADVAADLARREQRRRTGMNASLWPGRPVADVMVHTGEHSS